MPGSFLNNLTLLPAESIIFDKLLICKRSNGRETFIPNN